LLVECLGEIGEKVWGWMVEVIFLGQGRENNKRVLNGGRAGDHGHWQGDFKWLNYSSRKIKVLQRVRLCTKAVLGHEGRSA